MSRGQGDAVLGGSRCWPRQLIGGEGEASPDIIDGEFGEVGEQLRDGHPTGEVLQHIPDGDPHATNARLAATRAGFDGDEMGGFHDLILLAWYCEVNERCLPGTTLRLVRLVILTHWA